MTSRARTRPSKYKTLESNMSVNPTASATIHQISRDRSSARCAVSGIGVSTMPVVLLYDGRLHVLDIRTAFADLLSYRLIAVGVFLPFEGRKVLANRLLKFLTGPA